MPKDPRHELGQAGEAFACRELTRRGYEVVARRHRTRFGEIDIIARHGDATVFVEVKTRDGGRFGQGAAAVTPWKQRRIASMALDYIARNRLFDRPCRFDVVAIDVSSDPPRIEIYTNAFEAPAEL